MNLRDFFIFKVRFLSTLSRFLLSWNFSSFWLRIFKFYIHIETILRVLNASWVTNSDLLGLQKVEVFSKNRGFKYYFVETNKTIMIKGYYLVALCTSLMKATTEHFPLKIADSLKNFTKCLKNTIEGVCF